MTTLVITVISAAGLVLYFGATLFYRKPIVIKEIEFDIPSFKMALAQVFIGGADILMASLVLYFSLIPFVDISFDVFIGVFIIAQVLGVFSQVPGGLACLKGCLCILFPEMHNQAPVVWCFNCLSHHLLFDAAGCFRHYSDFIRELSAVCQKTASGEVKNLSGGQD